MRIFYLTAAIPAFPRMIFSFALHGSPSGVAARAFLPVSPLKGLSCARLLHPTQFTRAVKRLDSAQFENMAMGRKFRVEGATEKRKPYAAELDAPRLGRSKRLLGADRNVAPLFFGERGVGNAASCGQ